MANDRTEKRARIGNRRDRAIYKSAKGYKNSNYPRLCEKANRMNHFVPTKAEESHEN